MKRTPIARDTNNLCDEPVLPLIHKFAPRYSSYPADCPIRLSVDRLSNPGKQTLDTEHQCQPRPWPPMGSSTRTKCLRGVEFRFLRQIKEEEKKEIGLLDASAEFMSSNETYKVGTAVIAVVEVVALFDMGTPPKIGCTLP